MPELRFGDGILYFPITPFDDADAVDIDHFGELVAARLPHRPGAVFAACGTGEFHALALDEYREVVRAAVDVADSATPVLGGAGGPLGHARACALAAEQAGAAGLLVMPPYLVQGPQDGLYRYVADLASRTELPLIVYHRANAGLSAQTLERLLELPQVVGIKDGVGDVAAMQRFVRIAAASGRDIHFFNGLLTAELSQAAYEAIGVPSYSSAVFAMAPEIAVAFHDALRRGDREAQHRMLDEFFVPLVALRDEVPGFAVSLVKAGLRLVDARAGSVRPPLVDPDPAQRDRLRAILERGRRVAS